jgi:hypothetical protein
MNEPRNEAVDHDEFYVGYLPKAPTGVARAVRAAVAGFVVVGIVSAVVIAGSFRKPAAAEWGDDPVTLRGVVRESPYPMLQFADKSGAKHLALIVDGGKHGAAARVKGMEGATAEVRGTVLQRDGRMMIELEEGADAIKDQMQAAAKPLEFGKGEMVKVRGEIIDPKCFLGAMKPGEGKLHKACAIRCISGGIPPMLAERNAAGGITYYLLVREDGGPMNQRVLPYVAEPVEVSGRVETADDLRVLRVAADGIKPR